MSEYSSSHKIPAYLKTKESLALEALGAINTATPQTPNRQALVSIKQWAGRNMNGLDPSVRSQYRHLTEGQKLEFGKKFKSSLERQKRSVAQKISALHRQGYFDSSQIEIGKNGRTGQLKLSEEIRSILAEENPDLPELIERHKITAKSRLLKEALKNQEAAFSSTPDQDESKLFSLFHDKAAAVRSAVISGTIAAGLVLTTFISPSSGINPAYATELTPTTTTAATASETASSTKTAVTTVTPSVSPTSSATAGESITPTPDQTATMTKTSAPEPSATSKPTVTQEPTASKTAVASPTPTPTETATKTPSPTKTRMPKSTQVPYDSYTFPNLPPCPESDACQVIVNQTNLNPNFQVTEETKDLTVGPNGQKPVEYTQAGVDEFGVRITSEDKVWDIVLNGQKVGRAQLLCAPQGDSYYTQFVSAAGLSLGQENTILKAGNGLTLAFNTNNPNNLNLWFQPAVVKITDLGQNPEECQAKTPIPTPTSTEAPTLPPILTPTLVATSTPGEAAPPSGGSGPAPTPEVPVINVCQGTEVKNYVESQQQFFNQLVQYGIISVPSTETAQEYFQLLAYGKTQEELNAAVANLITQLNAKLCVLPATSTPVPAPSAVPAPSKVVVAPPSSNEVPTPEATSKPVLIPPVSGQTVPNQTTPSQISIGQALPEASPSSSEESTGQYTVQPGDSESVIAQKFGVSLSSLEAANPQISDPNKIYPGEKINIPSEASVSSPSDSGNPESTGQKFVTVERGDTLSAIAARAKETLSRILSLNRKITDPNLIYPGERIEIQ